MKRVPKEQRKVQIRNAAIQILASEGYFKTTTAVLSKELGVAEMIIYRSFKNKDCLVQESIQFVREERIGHWKSFAAKQGMNPIETLKQIAREFIKSPSKTSPNFMMLMRLSSERVPELIAVELSKTFQAYTEFLFSLLVKIHPNLNEDELRVRAFSLFEWAMGLGVMQMLPDNPSHSEEFLELQFQMSMEVALNPKEILKRP